MFRLIKILNSGVNVPEPCIIEKSTTLKVKMGSALVLSGGKASTCSATTAPTYIAIADAIKGETSVPCYPVNGDMLFETAIDGDPPSVNVGNKVTLSTDSDGCAVFVSDSTSSGVATVVHIGDAKKNGDKITVKF